MIMYMYKENRNSDILCITNRKLCREDFITRMRKIAAAHPAAVVVREKELLEKEYMELAEKNSEHMQGTGNRLYSAQLSGGSSGAGM